MSSTEKWREVYFFKSNKASSAGFLMSNIISFPLPGFSAWKYGTEQ
jgi:hypothetical protein